MNDITKNFKKIRLLSYYSYFILVVIGYLVLFLNGFFTPPEYEYGYIYDPVAYAAFQESLIFLNNLFNLVFYGFWLLPGFFVVFVYYFITSNNKTNFQKVLNNQLVSTQDFLDYMNKISDPSQSSSGRMKLLKCVRCSKFDDLTEITHKKKSRSKWIGIILLTSYKYGSTGNIASFSAPVCHDCKKKFQNFKKLRILRLVSYGLIFLFLIWYYFFSPLPVSGSTGPQFIIISIYYVLFTCCIEWILLQNKNNLRHFLRFSFSYHPRLKQTDYDVWLNYDDWMKWTIIERISIENPPIQQTVTQQTIPQQLDPPLFNEISASASNICEKCGSDNRPDDIFCGDCGEKLL